MSPSCTRMNHVRHKPSKSPCTGPTTWWAKPKEWKPDDLAPIVNHVLKVFGPDRVMFGGDWPVCTRAASLRQWVEALRAIVKDRPRGEQQKLFHDNAMRVYRLSV